jgi:ABC-type lipoprotein release transport system permease subunit
MFFTYLRRELSRRRRQASFIVMGIAVGIGLVITVTAAAAGVKDAQGTVLHSLYGVGTDVTVTQKATAGSGAPAGFRVGGGSAKAGTKFTRDNLVGAGMGTLKASSVSAISQLKHVSAAAGGLTLTDTRLSGTIPSSTSGGFGAPSGGGGGSSSFKINSFSVDGVDLSAGKVGVLSSGKITSGHTFYTSEANSDDALVTSDYATANSLKTGSAVTIAGTKFTVIGIVTVPAGTSSADMFIPLARAQALAGLKGYVNTIYVAADSASNISSVSAEISSLLPKATVTTSSSLASEVSGSLSSAGSLANNLGKWLAVAVLIAAFCLAALLMMAAVSRRVREFGTLKALGWQSRRVIAQVMGEALAMGVIGGVVGVGLGFGGAGLVDALAPKLSATAGSPTAASSGGAGSFGPGGGGGGGGFSKLAASAEHTVTVHLTAPVTVEAVLLAVLLAIVGGLAAGSLGGWRAARLRPAAALGRLE